MEIKRTKLSVIITCKKCNVIYAAHAIYGGVEIDKDFTMLMAEAEEKEDIIEFSREYSFGHCDCK